MARQPDLSLDSPSGSFRGQGRGQFAPEPDPCPAPRLCTRQLALGLESRSFVNQGRGGLAYLSLPLVAIFFDSSDLLLGLGAGRVVRTRAEESCPRLREFVCQLPLLDWVKSLRPGG